MWDSLKLAASFSDSLKLAITFSDSLKLCMTHQNYNSFAESQHMLSQHAFSAEIWPDKFRYVNLTGTIRYVRNMEYQRFYRKLQSFTTYYCTSTCTLVPVGSTILCC
jgi:hypothetical protein